MRSSDSFAEEDPLDYAQWRPPGRFTHAHYPIRHAQQVEAAQEAHVLLLRGMPQARRSGQATAGMDSRLVGHDANAECNGC